MIGLIEHIESLLSKEENEELLNGLKCIHLLLNVSIIDDAEFIKGLDNGK